MGTPRQALEWYKPRLIEMNRILKNNGKICLHCDWHLSHYLKIEMDNIFGIDNFRNEIIWRYKRWTASSDSKFQSMHDTILFYAKGKIVINHQYEKLEKPKKQNINTNDKKSVRDENGKVIYHTQTERQIDDVWEIPFLNPVSKERIGYDTQKPKLLLERIIKSLSNEGNVVADFFMGSCTTGEVALDLNRKFIGCDIGDKACEISKGRLNKYNQ